MPALAGHAVGDVVDVERGTAYCDDADEGLAYDLEVCGEGGVGAHGVRDGARGADNLVRGCDVAGLTDTHQTSPAPGNKGAGAGSRHIGGSVDTAGPVWRDEVLVRTQFRRAVEDGTVSLRRKTVLVGVAGDGSDAAETEVEERCGEASSA